MRLFATGLVMTLLAAPTLEFAPREGDAVRKSFELELELVSDYAHFYFEDERLDESEIGPTELTLSYHRSVSVLDTLERVDGPLIERWERVIESALESTEESYEVGDVSDRASFERGSFLEEETLVCSVDDDEWECVDEEGDEVDAGWDLDLFELLGDAEPEEGDTWSPTPESLAPLFRQAGAHWSDDFEVEADREATAETPLLLAALFAEAPEGEVEATWIDTVRHEGERVAVIELEAELLLEYWELREAKSGGEDEYDLELELELEGRALWSLDSGRLAELELEGEALLTLETESTLESEGRDFSMSVEARYSGDVSLSAHHESEE